MERIKNSISSFSVRTFPSRNKNCRKIGCSHRRKEHPGLSSGPFLPMGDLDLMAFYVQRKMDRSNQAPDDILKLIEQLTNVEEKVKAMEEKLGSGGVRHRHLNVMPVKENTSDKASLDQRRKKINRKRRREARCLCFPWSCRRERSEKEDKKKTNKAEMKSHTTEKKDVREGLQNVSRGSRVSWDEGITVRYIGDESSVEELITNKSGKNKVARKAYNHEESPEVSPDEDDVKNVVHVKIRIPKHKKQSSGNIIEIIGQNIEDDEDTSERVRDMKYESVLSEVKLPEVQESAFPMKEFVDGASMEESKSPISLMSADSIRTGRRRYETPVEQKQVSEKAQPNGKVDDQSDDVDIVNSVEIGDSLKPLASSDISKNSEQKKSLEREMIFEKNSALEHEVDLDSKMSSKKNISNSETTTEAKKRHPSRPSTPKKDETLMQEQVNFESLGENAQDHVTPIAVVENSSRMSLLAVVGIPIKETGRRSCGSKGCGCKGSTRNDSNLSELKKSLKLNPSETSLLDRMVDTSPEPEELNVLTEFGLVNVVSHPRDCNCIVCETFGSRKETSKRNSVRSDTGAVISKRVVRVGYNENFRNVLTHTEECGCDLCINIDKEIYRHRPKRSTQMSTRDSVLFVHNKGLCGCTNCKTVTSFKKDSIEMEQYKRDMEQQIKDDEEEMRMNSPTDNESSMASKTSYQTIDPCYYSQVTVPSMRSFPMKHIVKYDSLKATCPSIDSLDSSEEEITRPRNKLKCKEIVVKPKSKRLSLKDECDADNSILIVSSKPPNELDGLKNPSSDELPHKSHRRKGSLRSNSLGFARISPDGEYERVSSEWWHRDDVSKEDTPKDPHYKPQKPKNKRNKTWQDQPHHRERETVDLNHRQADDLRGRKSRKNSKKIDRSDQKSRKLSNEHRVVTNEIVEVEDPQITLEEIIKDLVSGRSDESGNKTYRVTLGRIHNKPYTKVKIIDCSKPRIKSSTSILSSETLQCTSYEKEGSDSAVYFSKPFPSISVSPTCSSNFARSGETSVVDLSQSVTSTNNRCQGFDPVHQSYSLSISPSPSLLIISPFTADEIENGDRELKKDDKRSEPAMAKVIQTSTTRPTLNQEISHQKMRQRLKKSKFKIKLGGKVRSFFKRNERKKMAPLITTVNNDIQ